MQIKTAMRKHLTPIRMVPIKEPKQPVVERRCRNRTLGLCWEEGKLVQLLWKTVRWLVLFFFNVLIIWSGGPTAGCTPRRIPSKVSKRSQVHTMFVAVALFTIVKMWKQPKCPRADVWISKMWYINTLAYLFSPKKERPSAVCVSMGEPWGHDAKWNKPVTKRQKLYDSTYMSYFWVIKILKDKKCNGGF